MKDIILKNITKKYGEKTVLDHFSCVFRGGETTCIMGQSGCGKSTLLNILMGFEPADGGEILNMPKKLSAVFQENRLCEEFSAMANIRMVTGKTRSEAEIRKHLTLLGLEESLHKPVRAFSGGMKRRTAIARAVLFESELLFMDEPFKGLDADTKEQVMQYVMEYTKGKTLVVVTHDEEECKTLGGALIRMKESKE